MDAGTGKDRGIKRLNAFERGKRRSARVLAPRPCERCQTIFTPKRENPDEPARFCSSPCRSAHWREERRDLERLLRRVADLESRVSVLEAKR